MVPQVAALAVAAMLTGALPGGGWNDALALLASVAALIGAQERRDRDMIVAVALAAGLAPAGWLLVPLCAGLAIRRGATRHLCYAPIVGTAVLRLLPWPDTAVTLPNLAAVVAVAPAMLALVAAFGLGAAAWLGARASILPPAGVLAEARFGAILLASVLPLPLSALCFVLTFAALPLPSPPRLRAANDNVVLRRALAA